MEMNATDAELGPIDVVVIGYPEGAPMTGDATPLFLDLVDRGIIRVLDVLFVRKNEIRHSRGSTSPIWTRAA
jgi:hypothetical protein